VVKSQLVPSVTTGSRAASTVGTTVTAGDTTIAIDVGSGTETVKAGEVFTVAGRYKVNPQTGATITSELKTFTVLEDAVASGGIATVNVGEAIYASGAKKNVSALPTASDAIIWVGAQSSTYGQALAFVPEFAGIAFANLVLPEDAKSARESYKGISMRMVERYDIDDDLFKVRFDIVMGVVMKVPEMAAKFIRTSATTAA